jgi:hypothetical protein
MTWPFSDGLGDLSMLALSQRWLQAIGADKLPRIQ